MAETEYLREGDILVTNARAVLQGKTYAMANITSVSMGEVPAKRAPGFVLAAIGLAIAACGGGFGGDQSAIGIIIGILVLAAGVALALLAKKSYAVRIGSSSGEVSGLAATDMDRIQRIVNAMNEAIVKRG